MTSRSILKVAKIAVGTSTILYVSFVLLNQAMVFESGIYESVSFLEDVQLGREQHHVADSDPRLIELIKQEYLHSPAEYSSEYKFSYQSGSDPTVGLKMKGQTGQAILMDRILRRKRDGFFIEAGAFDGEYLSNTLLFEIKRNWTGLLIEPNKDAYKSLIQKNRKAYSINACLSLSVWPKQMEFLNADVYSGITNDSRTSSDRLESLRNSIPDEQRSVGQVQCFPLYSLLLSLGNPQVDYLSLDVEGSELLVLETVPWPLVDIRVLTVEVAHAGNDQEKRIVDLMKANGYRVYRRMEADLVFVREDVI